MSALALLYADLLLAAREERWVDVLLTTDALEEQVAGSPELARWCAILRAFALERRGEGHADVEDALAPAHVGATPCAPMIPARPELRDFVERRVDARLGT